jgi:hypothetical protein
MQVMKFLIMQFVILVANELYFIFTERQAMEVERYFLDTPSERI